MTQSLQGLPRIQPVLIKRNISITVADPVPC
jgi:hypothetical protein